MMSSRAGGGAGAGRYPFTASQWQELEHQALIYKCLASGKPIPSYLMPPLRRILDSALATSPSLAFPPQPSRTFHSLLFFPPLLLFPFTYALALGHWLI